MAPWILFASPLPLMAAMKRSKQWKKKCPSSYDFSFFGPMTPVEQEVKWLDEVWLSISYAQRIDAMLPYSDEKGRSLLSMAVRRGDHELMHMLLFNPAMQVNQVDIYGNSPVHHAILVKDDEALAILLGAPHIITSLANKDNRTPYNLLAGGSEVTAAPHHLAEYCFVRTLIDQTSINYCLAHPARILKTRTNTASVDSLQKAIRELYEAMWFLTEYRDRPFPVKLVPITLQNQIIQARFNDFITQHQ